MTITVIFALRELHLITAKHSGLYYRDGSFASRFLILQDQWPSEFSTGDNLKTAQTLV